MEIIREKALYGIKKDDDLSILKQDAFLLFAAADEYELPPEHDGQDKQDEYEALSILENGDWLLVRDNGTAISQSGKTYARVSEEVEAEPMPPDDPYMIPFTLKEIDEEPPETEPIPDTDLVTLGWTTESDAPIIMTRIDGELRIIE